MTEPRIYREEMNQLRTSQNQENTLKKKENNSSNNQKKNNCECPEILKPDCCFISGSCCCNCRDNNNYPSINGSNALISTIIFYFVFFLFLSFYSSRSF